MQIHFVICDMWEIQSISVNILNFSFELSGSDWFGELADHFGNDAVSQMSTYFHLPPRKRDQIQESKNSGLELLSVLEAKEVIGQKAGIDELCEALQFCSLNKLAREAKELYNKPREIPGHDTPGKNVKCENWDQACIYESSISSIPNEEGLGKFYPPPPPC